MGSTEESIVKEPESELEEVHDTEVESKSLESIENKRTIQASQDEVCENVESEPKVVVLSPVPHLPPLLSLYHLIQRIKICLLRNLWCLQIEIWNIVSLIMIFLHHYLMRRRISMKNLLRTLRLFHLN